MIKASKFRSRSDKCCYSIQREAPAEEESIAPAAGGGTEVSIAHKVINTLVLGEDNVQYIPSCFTTSVVNMLRWF